MAMVVILPACGPSQNAPSDEEKPVVALNCNKDMTEYKVEGTSMKFCYDKTWGEPVVENAKAKAGSAMTISFGSASNAKAPVVQIESKDFAPEQGEKKVKFEFMNATQSDEAKLKEQLKNAAGYDESNVRARKSDVGGVRAIRAEVGNELVYFVPDAFPEHHVLFSGPLSEAELVDNFAFDMAF